MSVYSLRFAGRPVPEAPLPPGDDFDVVHVGLRCSIREARGWTSGDFCKYAANNRQPSGLMQLASGRPTMATITAADTRVSGMAFQTTLNGLGGNSRAPEPVHRSDLRLNKILPFGAEGRYKLTLNLEAFNVTINAQSYSERPRVWGRVTRWV